MTIRNDFRNILGMTQEELANMLGVTRSQLSMCELGKRDVSLAAKEKLAEVLTHLQTNKSIPEHSNKIMEVEKQQTQEWLQRELKEAAYRELLLDRKIETVLQVRKEAFKALDVVVYLEKQSEERLKSLAQSIKNRATNTLNKYSLQHLEALALKKEAHQMLKLKIEQKLKF